LCCLILLTLGALAASGPARDLTGLPPKERGAIFERVHDDLIRTCSLASAATGPLREHCLDEARLVLLFPECDDRCRRDATALLPRAHR
jgi:cytochrome b pre-mRNA-processing protein 3